jgi:hypothetical protein
MLIRPLNYLIILAFLVSANINAQTKKRTTDVTFVYMEEGFEAKNLPVGWVDEFVGRPLEWKYNDGGFQIGSPPIPGANNPPAAYEGSYNAWYSVNSNVPYVTKLVTKPIDLEYARKAQLHFWHAQVYRSGTSANDKLKVYYKSSEAGTWTLLRTYSEKVDTWTKQIIPLPEASYTGTYYIAFEGINARGNGVCIDKVQVVETEAINREIKEVNIVEDGEDFVRSGTKNNRTSKVEIKVAGNTNDLTLQSFTFGSLCTDNNDIENSGIKLMYSVSDDINTASQIGTGVSVVGNKAIINGLSTNLVTGSNYFWLTTDIKQNAGSGNSIGFNIPLLGITTNTGTYPETTKQYSVTTQVLSSVFFDDFETDKGWTMTGEWERAAPAGLGGAIGNPDPDNAYSGDKIIGTDITGLGITPGDYEKYLAENAYVITSPEINVLYYKNVHINFFKWFNIDSKDRATIDISLDNGATWKTVKTNVDIKNSSKWDFYDIDISEHADRQPSLRVRFTLGPTDEFSEYSGWNIDDFAVTGILLKKDVSVISVDSPRSECGHTATETVTVKVKNFAGVATDPNTPIRYSIDGTTVVDEVIPQVINPSEVVTFSFATKADLSIPGDHPNAYVTTMLAGDQDASNDRNNHPFYTAPTITPPYSQDFESDQTHWYSKRESPLWKLGEPIAYVINKASSGAKSWITNPEGAYDDSQTEYLESPCYDFTTMKHPMVEFNIWLQTQEHKDGLNLQYSTDKGATWVDIENSSKYSTYWNWYNGKNVAAIGKDGFNGVTADYINVKHLLPDVLIGADCVKFRIVFYSDDSNSLLEGASVDDFKVYDSPRYVTVEAIKSPITSCFLPDEEDIVITLKNEWIDDIKKDETINLSLKINDELIVEDTYTLPDNFAKGTSRDYTFSKKHDFSARGDYKITAECTNNPAPLFYSNVNVNKKEETISVHKPVVDLGEDIYTLHPENVVLNAYDIGTETYEWDGDPALNKATLALTGPGTHRVVVTRKGCNASDEIKVVKLIRDVGVSKIISPISACSFTNNEKLTIEIKNFGTDTLKVGDKIEVGHRISKLATFETSIITLDKKIDPQGTMEHTFSTTFALGGSVKNKYLGASAKAVREEEVPANNIIDHDFVAHGFPTYNYPHPKDTITVSAIQHLLDAGPGWDAYKWKSGETTQTKNSEEWGWNVVTIFDDNNCPAKDSIFLNLRYTDIKISELTAPANRCKTLDKEKIKLKIINSGTDTLEIGDEIRVSYIVKGAPLIDEDITLDKRVFPNAEIIHTSNHEVKPLDPSTQFILTSELQNRTDHKPGNDETTIDVKVFGYPVLDFGPDVTTRDFPYVLDAGVHQKYLWQDGATTQTYDVMKTGDYEVTVTDNDICSTTDQIKVSLLVVDLEPAIVTPVTACTHTDSEAIKINLTNHGNDILTTGTTVNIKIDLDGTESSEDFVMPSDLNPAETKEFTLAKTVDLSAKKPDYKLKITTNYSKEYNAANDAVESTISTHGLPAVDLGEDKVIRTGEITLDAGDFASYLWNDNSTNRTLKVTTTGDYYVTVTDANGCSKRDDINIKSLIPDLSLTSIVTPTNACTHTNAEEVKVKIVNVGTDTVMPGTEVTLKINMNKTDVVTEVYEFTKKFYPTNEVEFLFRNTIDLSKVKTHPVTVKLEYTGDLDMDNNNLDENIKTSGHPVFSLGNDTIIYDPYTLNPGDWSTYKWHDNSTEKTCNADGTGLYSVTVTNADGCESSDEIDIIMQKAEIKVHNLVSPKAAECNSDMKKGKIVEFEIENTGERNYKVNDKVRFEYTLGTAKSTVSESIIIPTSLKNGQKTVLRFTTPLKVDDAGDYALGIHAYPSNMFKSFKEFNLKANSNPSFSFNPDTTKTNALPVKITSPVDANGYNWNTGATTKEIDADAQKWYTLTISNEHNCTFKDSTYVKLESTNAIKDGKEQFRTTIIPNPADDHIRVTLPNTSSDKINVYIFNSTGERVIFTEAVNNNGSTEINVSRLSNGLYTLVIITDKYFISERFIKK